jgi:putative transposase
MNTYKRHRFRLGAPHLISFPTQSGCTTASISAIAGVPDHKINGKQHYLWRAVDQDGEVVDVFLQAKRDGAAAKRFFKRLLRSHGGEPRKIVTDKLRSYGVAQRELMPGVIHDNARYANNRAEQSHEPTRVRERGMRWSDISEFKSVGQAQRFLGTHAAVSNLFNLGRHLVRAEHYRSLRMGAFSEWSRAVA